MKRLTAILLAMLMLVSVGAFSPVAAAEEEILKDAYTFMDTCYSPELDVYVAVAKDMTHAHRKNDQSTPGQIFYSNDGSAWFPAKLPSSQFIHYANPETRQCVVWWKKEGVFVAVADNKLFISRDGATWTENAAWWHVSDGNLRTRSNTTIAVNDNQLVTVTGSVIRTYDSLADQYVAYQVGSGLYMQAAGVSTDEPAVYFGLAQNYYHVVTGRKDQTGVNAIGTQINETKNGIPVETVYSEKLGGWIVLNQTDTMHIVTKTAKSCVDVKNILLSNGERNKAVLSAAAVSGDTVILGNADGNLFTAPLEKDSITSAETEWTLVAPYDDDVKIPTGDEIRSITTVDDKAFFFATPTKLYAAVKSEDGWRYYDTTKTVLALEGENRIEIPPSDSATGEFEVKAMIWNGKQASDDTIAVEVVGTAPEGVSVETAGGSFSVIVSSEVKGDCKLEVKASSENARTKIFDIFIIDEKEVRVEGFDVLLVPDKGEDAVQYSYSAVVIGSDDKLMTTRNAVIEVEESSVPNGVTFDKVGNGEVTLTITSSAPNTSIVINAVSEMHPEYKAKKVVKLSGRYAAKVEVVSGVSDVVISDSENVTAQYTAQVYDQIGEEIAQEECQWSVVPAVSGVSIEADSGVLEISPQASDGIIAVRASVKSAPDIFGDMEVTLSYTDLRKFEEDIKALNIKDGSSLSQNTVLVLPSKGKYGSRMTWKCSDETLLRLSNEADGLRGVAISPSREDKKVLLTVTAEKESFVQEITFEVTIKKAETLCTNGDFADGTYNGWEKKSEQTTRAIIQENDKNVLQVVGDGVYQILNFTNDSSYAFEAKVKADSGKTVRLTSQNGGTIAVLTADGTYRDMKGSLDFRKMNNSFEDKIYLESDGVLTIDNLKVYEITLELDAVTAAVNKAVYSKKKEDVTRARTLLADFYDLPIKNELEKKLDGIDTSSGGNSSGSAGGGGGGSKAPSTVGGTVAPSAPALPEKAEDNYSDELDTFLLNFKDMKNHWAREDVEYMAGLSLVSGKETGVFAPEDNISRAEFAVLITRVMGLEQTAYENSFYDIVSEDWYSGYVQTVKSNNLMNGYDGLFRPEAAISREEIAKVIVEAYNSKTNGKLEKGGALYFNDLTDISYWAYDYIVEAVNLGFINGVSEDIFAPQNLATRAEAVVMLRRVYDKLHAEK